MHFDQLVLMSLTFVVQVPRKKSVRFADIHYPSDAEEEPDTGSENSGRFDFVILDTKHMHVDDTIMIFSSFFNTTKTR